MAKVDNVKYWNSTESGLVKNGAGAVYGVVVNSHTSGTLKLVDGLENGVQASGTLTSSGACAPADYATATLTSSGVNVSDGDTVTINTTVYRFKNTMAQAYDVKIGTDAATSLDNLKAAINASGTAGTEYFAGTVAHPEVIATTNGDTTQVIRARAFGTDANAYDTLEAAATLSWGGATMSGGVATTAATITIGSVTYTVTKTLTESIGLTAVANQVLWVTSEAVFLDNLKLAINASGIAGTEYSTGTEPHPTVYATTNTNTQQTVVAKTAGTSGNAIATTETMANYAWGGAVLSGGTGASGVKIMNTFTFPTGSGSYMFPTGVSFYTGLQAVAGGTAIDYTLLYD